MRRWPAASQHTHTNHFKSSIGQTWRSFGYGRRLQHPGEPWVDMSRTPPIPLIQGIWTASLLTHALLHNNSRHAMLASCSIVIRLLNGSVTLSTICWTCLHNVLIRALSWMLDKGDNFRCCFWFCCIGYVCSHKWVSAQKTCLSRVCINRRGTRPTGERTTAVKVVHNVIQQCAVKSAFSPAYNMF